MSKVLITPNGKTGSLVSAYQSNPEFGYLQLTQTSLIVGGGWVRESKRSTLMRGKVSLLNTFVAMHKSLVVPGKLVVKEFVESAVPADIQARFISNPQLTYEENVSPYVKRAGKDGDALTAGGERILRFTIWDESGTDTDMSVAHDNGVKTPVSGASTDASFEA